MQGNSATTGSLSAKAGVLAASRIVTTLAQVASIVILTRLLSKEDFGTLSFLLLGYTTVVTLGQLGLPESIFYFFERVDRGARKPLALGTGKALFVIGLAGGLILIALNFVAPVWGFEVHGLFFPLVLLILVELPTTPLPNILIAIDRTGSAARFNIAVGLLQFSAMVVPAVLGLPLSAIVAALVGYGVVRFVLSYVLFFRNFGESDATLPPGILRQQFSYSLPLAASQIIWAVNRQIDKYVVAALLPVAVYAEYVVGAWEIPFIPAIVYSVSAVMMPRLVSLHSESRTEELLGLWVRSIRKLSGVVLPLAVFFIFFAEEFISVFFTADYVAAALPFRIYTLIILHRVAAYTAVLKAVDETPVITRSAALLLTTNLLLSVPLALWLGVAGPPLATLLANAVAWAYVLRAISRSLSVGISEVFPFGFYLRALTVSVAAGAVAFWGARAATSGAVPVLLAGVIAFPVVYLISARATGVVTREQIGALRKFLRTGGSSA